MAAIDAETLGALFDRHGPALVLYARQWCGTPEDVVQDAFVTLARARGLPDRVLPWLFRVVRNAAINAGRGARNRKARESRSSSAEAWLASDDDRIDASAAARLLEDLDPPEREALVARFWGGLTFDEIARLQGCSVATAHRRYQNGLTHLNERLAGRWNPQTSTPNAT
ncbi:sigma-70 family RNA polymerase sigma factor [Isosphaeraceae bacterium EP7]